MSGKEDDKDYSASPDVCEFEMLYCLHDILTLYCTHHKLIYGRAPERLGGMLEDTRRRMQGLEDAILAEERRK